MAEQNSQNRLDAIDDDFRRAVFFAVYRSPTQRLRRFIAMLLLLIKYLLRGLLILWPVYLVILLGLLVPDLRHYLWYFLVLLPGLMIWLLIYLRGVRREYDKYVNGVILQNGFIKQIFLH